MNLEEKLRDGKFVVTCEIAPPKGTDLSSTLKGAAILKGRADGVNVTDMQGAIVKASALPVCVKLLEDGIEPILQVTCRDRNRIGLQGDLLAAAIFGIRNLLVLSGDPPQTGDHPDAKPVFDLDVITLLDTIQKLNHGTDLGGNPLKGTPSFFPGAAANPGSQDLDREIDRMGQKVRAGARFFQTQAVFDPAVFAKFMDRAQGLRTPVIAGIIMIKSASMARYMNKNIPGIRVPEPLMEEVDQAADKPKAAVAIAARIIKEIRPLCQGVHVMPIGWDEHVPKLLDAAGI